MSSAASERPGEIVSVEQMFHNLHFILLSVWALSPLYSQKSAPSEQGKPARCSDQAPPEDITEHSARFPSSPPHPQGN